MSDELQPDAAPDEAAGFPTIRSVVLGCVLCGIIGLAGPYWTIYLQSSRMFADYHTAGATFLLFLILIPNFVLRAIWKPLGLRMHELMTVGAMMLVGGSIATSGLIAYFMPAISSAYYFANSSNNWALDVWPHLPQALSPLDPNGGTVAITKFWEGVPGDEPIQWGPWIGPLFTWGIFLMALFACMMAIMTIMRKQWMDREHLSFPIAQVPAELCAAGTDPAGPGSIFRSKGFWIGLGATFLLASAGGIVHYMGGDWFFRIRYWVDFAQEPWRLPIYVDLVVMGLVFLIPNRIAFTVWFVALLSWIVRSVMQEYALRMPGEWVYGNEMSQVAMGATVTFVIASLWLSREHLKRALRCALGRGDRDYDAGEPSSYRTAFLTVIIGLIVACVWLHRMGLGHVYAVLLVLITLAVYYAMARVVAQCGVPMLSPPMYPNHFMVTLFGPATLGSQRLSVLGMHMGWHFDMRNSVMSGSGHGMFLARRRRNGLFWAMLLGLLVTYVAAYFCTVWVCYRHGGVNMDSWFFGTYPKLFPSAWIKAAMAEHGGPSYVRMVWAAGGAIAMAALVVAHRSLFWWPLHPVGLLICSSHMVYYFWVSVFLAWLVKVLLLKIGGQAMFRPARRFFIGMVMGYFLAGGTWAIIDTITGSSNNPVFYI